MSNSEYHGDERFEPLSPWAYVGYSILFWLPLIGLIFIIVFSMSDSNVNRRSYARSYLCWIIIGIIIGVIILATGMLPVLISYINNSRYFS